MKYVNRLPTESDIGKLFFVKHLDGEYSSIFIMEVRKDSSSEQLYFSKESSTGWNKSSYGTPVSMYKIEHTYMAGPIDLPEGFRA